MNTPQLDLDACWTAVKDRDADYDGELFYGVVTTGVFCKPSCAARRPLRENVRFFSTTREAKAAGFRPCKRCKPADAMGAPLAGVLALCRYIEENPDKALKLEVLSEQSGLSTFQVHRFFKSFLGVTPRQYIEQVRLGHLKDGLRSAPSVIDAIFEAGFQSTSVVYGGLDTRLGMTPKQYREGGEGVEISFAIGRTALGLTAIGATDRGVCFLEFGDSKRELLERLSREYPRALLTPMPDHSADQFEGWMVALDEHLSGARKRLDLPLDVRGTAFQRKVWDFLQKIPYGAVMSYGEVAAAIEAPSSSRAVAGACAGNRLGVLIPCHRVLRGDGSLGGYRWGLDRKRALIDAERRHGAAAKTDR